MRMRIILALLLLVVNNTLFASSHVEQRAISTKISILNHTNQPFWIYPKYDLNARFYAMYDPYKIITKTLGMKDNSEATEFFELGSDFDLYDEFSVVFSVNNGVITARERDCLSESKCQLLHYNTFLTIKNDPETNEIRFIISYKPRV